jgi:hypothetical protein
MTYSAEAKLQELRNKTNRELVSLIGNTLDRGLEFACLPDGEEVAQEAFAQASAWIPLLGGRFEGRQLEAKLSALREALESSQVRVQAAC